MCGLLNHPPCVRIRYNLNVGDLLQILLLSYTALVILVV